MVAEDQVDYRIYILEPEFTGLLSSGRLDEAVTYARGLALALLDELAPHTRDYLWQRDGFHLDVHVDHSSSASSGVPAVFLRGTVRFGENIEDEWFIVSLLQRATQAHGHLAASVQDTDGEFLLIQAAESVPDWADSSTSVNRVFLYRGLVHLIPVPTNMSELASFPMGDISVAQALSFLSSNAEAARASEGVQKAVGERTAPYAENSGKFQHRARVHLPASAAWILRRCPQLVAPAVERFYLRDPVALRVRYFPSRSPFTDTLRYQACLKMATFPPSTSVATTVQMNRCMYAQLKSQQFIAPRLFSLPASHASDYVHAELGMKLVRAYSLNISEAYRLIGMRLGNACCGRGRGPRIGRRVSRHVRGGV